MRPLFLTSAFDAHNIEETEHLAKINIEETEYLANNNIEEMELLYK